MTDILPMDEPIMYIKTFSTSFGIDFHRIISDDSVMILKVAAHRLVDKTMLPDKVIPDN